MTPTDPLYASQWHFAFMGDIERIWDEYSGAGVNVGVYDDGIDYNHPDLIGNYNSSLHVLDNLGNPLDPFYVLPGDSHGTATAGLIGASANNGTGGTGVAWGVDLTSVNIFGGGFGDVNGNLADFLTLVHQATNFDISSNSWGGTSSYVQSLAGGGFSDQLEDEYAFISANGRGGLGTIVTQAAGNDTLDANGDGTNASRYTITVSATEQTGNIAFYSNFGASILVAAPAASVTTDISGPNGYNPGDYTNAFNGTSAATPVVSGVIALMLEANPNLGWRDVQNILAASASHTGSAFGGPQNGVEHGVWGFNAANNWNGGGMHSQIDYGYGMINAYNAVRMAEVWNLFGSSQSSANEQTTSSAVVNLGALAVPDNDPLGVSFNITVGTNLLIEHMQLVMNFSHTWVGDLRVELTSAEGTSIVVALNSFDVGTSFNGTWVYGIDSLRGELSAGTWTVRVVDTFGDDTGVLNTASLNVFGTAVSVNDVHHITDEFLAMVALNAGRSSIDDTNGGTDWISFATIAGNVNLNLNAGSAFTVDAVNWGTISAGTVIENAIGGDGNDTITGTTADNVLRGMRGNDTLIGGVGADTMFGGQGDDRIYVDNLGDVVTELAGQGLDSIFATISATSALNVERFYLQGSGNFSATGVNGQNDIIYGNGGNNVINGLTGTDNMNGGLGDDTYHVNTSGDVINEAAAGGTLDTVFSQSSYTINANVERLFLLNGGSYNANGRNGQNDFIAGNDQNNIINGLSGNDTIRGGLGNDTLTGGTGLDIFQFLTAPNTVTNRDFITDFTAVDDTIQMDNAIFGLLGAPGALAAALFKNLNLGAQDANDAVLYDQANGNLYYDNNGLATGGVVQFAEFVNGTAITAADFVIV